jgi:hypothetical protein
MQVRRIIVGAGLTLGLFAIFAAIGLYEAGLHGGTGPTAVTFEVALSGGRMTPSTLSVREGDQVVLSITSDRSQTIRIGGYGLSYQLNSATPVAATFVAYKPGTFDILLSETGAKLGVLKVS